MMYFQNELKNLARRLFEEKICTQPLDDRSLNEIYRYMGMIDTGCELMRRLSDIEENYVEMTNEAYEATCTIKEALNRCEKLFKALIDGWTNQGLINNYSFSVNQTNISQMYQSYSIMTEELSEEIRLLAGTSERIAEAALQIKACSASFLEVCNETKLAIYAASLNEDKENTLSCKAIMLQAHDSYSESSRNSARYISVARSCENALAVLSNVLSETTCFFSTESLAMNSNLSPLVNQFIRGIESLKNIALSIKTT